MLQKTETARRWHGERLPNVDLAGELITSEDSPSARQAQRLAIRFGLTLVVADVIAAHHFGRAT